MVLTMENTRVRNALTYLSEQRVENQIVPIFAAVHDAAHLCHLCVY